MKTDMTCMRTKEVPDAYRHAKKKPPEDCSSGGFKL